MSCYVASTYMRLKYLGLNNVCSKATSLKIKNLTYRTLWNGFKRIAAKAGLRDAEKIAIFISTAAGVYRLESR